MSEKRLIKIEEVASLLRVPVERLLEEVTSGRLSAFGIGNQWRLRISSVDAALRERLLLNANQTDPDSNTPKKAVPLGDVIVQRFADGEREFEGLQAPGCFLIGQHLAGIILRQSNLEDAELSDSDLRFANFKLVSENSQLVY